MPKFGEKIYINAHSSRLNDGSLHRDDETERF